MQSVRLPNQMNRPKVVLPKKKILILNCFVPEIRESIQMRNLVPNTLAPVFLAGMFSSENCEIRCYNEVNSGFIEERSPDLLDWPDLVVLTGLISAFDRFLQTTAYFKTRNPGVIVVAGGTGIRALPKYSAKFFDYVCLGDAEELGDVIPEALGAHYMASDPQPRYDLAYWMRRVGYAESSRNCNFRCSFCTLTGEGRRYEEQGLEHLKRQILSMGPRQIICFLDNQFFGPNRQFFLDRMALLRELKDAGHLGAWTAICTNTILWNEDNLHLAREAGCLSLFIGVESFDPNWLKGVKKSQNNRHSQIDLIERCIRAGILFQYGIVYDPSERSTSELRLELDYIFSEPRIPPPNFIFTAIPFPGTPFFHDRYRNDLILPNTKTRDLEGSTLSLRPVDGVEETAKFLSEIKYFKGYRRKLFAHQLKMLQHYRKYFSPKQFALSNACILSLLSPSTMSYFPNFFVKRRPRTHVSTTERLDDVYQPRMYIGSSHESYFRPTHITDSSGVLNPLIEEDVLMTRFKHQLAS